MILKSVTKQTSKGISEIWQKYADLPTWHTWDKETEYAKLDGQFVEGGTGVVKPKGSPEAKFTLIELTENKSFTVCCRLPLAKIKFNHLLVEKNESTVEVTHSVELDGFLAPLWKIIIGKSLVNGLESTIDNLV